MKKSDEPKLKVSVPPKISIEEEKQKPDPKKEEPAKTSDSA